MSAIRLLCFLFLCSFGLLMPMFGMDEYEVQGRVTPERVETLFAGAFAEIDSARREAQNAIDRGQALEDEAFIIAGRTLHDAAQECSEVLRAMRFSSQMGDDEAVDDEGNDPLEDQMAAACDALGHAWEELEALLGKSLR